MNTTAVVITAIICATVLLSGFSMVFYDYMTEKLKSEVKMEDKLKLEIEPTLCDECERRLECKSKMEITMLRDDLRRFIPPFEGCVMTEGEKKGDKCNEA